MIARTPAASHPPVVIDELEAHQKLLARARSGIFDPIEPKLIVDHLFTVIDSEAGWPVLRDGLEAVVRRMAFARRDGLRVADRPKGRLGVYSVRRPRESPRPYRTLLRSVDPIAGSCDCPDFLRNSLGLCKHLLIVLADLAEKPRVWSSVASREPLPSTPPRGGFVWNPICPLTGSVDWLLRVSWSGPGEPPAAVRKAFDASGDLRPAWTTDPTKRRTLITTLRRSLARRSAGSVEPDPALIALVEAEHAEPSEHRGATLSGRALDAELKKLKVELYPYQRESVRKFLSTGRLLLADDMGLGKTAQAIASSTVLFHRKQIRRALVVCPAPLKAQWVGEWSRFSDVPIAAVDGSPDDRETAYRQTRQGTLVVNYEQLLRDGDLVEAWDPDLVVLDEAQRIKNWATKTALAVKQLEPRYRLVLTGTPIENRLDELVSIVEWVDGFALEPKWRVNPWHAITADGDGGGTIGVRGLDTLRERLEPWMLRRVREDVIAELPPRSDSVLRVSVTRAQLELHDDLAPDIIRLLRISQKRPLTQPEFLRLMSLLNTQRVIANGLAQQEFVEVWRTIESRRPTQKLLTSLSSPKLEEFRELISQLLEQRGRKVVVFSQWRRALQLAHWAIHDLLEARGERAVFFTGRESQKRRTHNIVDFHDDPTARLFFASDAGGTGLNLQRAANCIINFELPWNPAVLEQRIGRVYRLGQKKPIDVYNLMSDGTIEAHVAQLIHNKKALFDGLFDGDSDSLLFESSGQFLGQLREVYPERPPTRGQRDADVRSPDDPEESPEVEAALEAADESTDTATEPVPTQPGDASRVQSLFRGVRLETHDDGSLTLNADPQAAQTLAAMFEGMAQLLNQAAHPTRPESNAPTEKTAVAARKNSRP